jgi:hypothetical protein
LIFFPAPLLQGVLDEDLFAQNRQVEP